jgi:hypothetical protein
VTLLDALDMAVEQTLPDIGVPAGRADFLESPKTAVLRYLRDLSARGARPLVVLIDEADCLVGPASPHPTRRTYGVVVVSCTNPSRSRIPRLAGSASTCTYRTPRSAATRARCATSAR